jgi:hypothetical protein
MRRTTEVALATILLALCLTKAAAEEAIEGTWEGKTDGRRSATLVVAEIAGRLEGHVIFYVLDKKFSDPDAKEVGQEEHEIRDLKWDGKVLSFSIPEPDFKFTMTVTGDNRGVLKRFATAEQPELTINMQRR